MLDSSNSETFPAISELCEIAAHRKRPLVFWIGAGTSRWAGLPSWADFTANLHKEFVRKEPSYDRATASGALEKQDFPSVFGLCQRSSRQRYNKFMLEALTSGTPTAIYKRFIDAITRIEPASLITTNTDELLEQRIAAHVVMSSDFEIVPQFLAEKKSFIAKLHGSVSQIDSLTFTDAEYANLLSEKSLINALTRVFEISTVVFIGYGLRDDYVLKQLNTASDLAQLFGTGPHFACRSTTGVSLPPSVRTIKYIAEPHRDHRTVIQVIEELGPALEGHGTSVFCSW